MKFTVTFRDPDTLLDTVTEDVALSIDKEHVTADDEEKEALTEVRMDKVMSALEKFVKYSELITIEFDTELGTATVVPVKTFLVKI